MNRLHEGFNGKNTETRKLRVKEIDVGYGSGWKISQNSWETITWPSSTT